MSTSDDGTPRLVLVFDPDGERHPENVHGAGIDLRPADRGRAFAERVVAACQTVGEEPVEPRWRHVALDPDAPVPSDDMTDEIGALQHELAALMTEPAPLLAETQRMKQILIELHARGARPDAEFINRAIDQDSRERPSHLKTLSQDEFDDWQRRAVEDASAG